MTPGHLRPKNGLDWKTPQQVSEESDVKSETSAEAERAGPCLHQHWTPSVSHGERSH